LNKRLYSQPRWSRDKDRKVAPKQRLADCRQCWQAAVRGEEPKEAQMQGSLWLLSEHRGSTLLWSDKQVASYRDHTSSSRCTQLHRHPSPRCLQLGSCQLCEVRAPAMGEEGIFRLHSLPHALVSVSGSSRREDPCCEYRVGPTN
jgi:hypothetical protein